MGYREVEAPESLSALVSKIKRSRVIHPAKAEYIIVDNPEFNMRTLVFIFMILSSVTEQQFMKNSGCGFINIPCHGRRRYRIQEQESNEW